MTLISDIVARLIAAGTPPEVAAVAVTDAFAAGAASGKSGGSPVDEAAERRRAYDRERKRQKRNSGGSPVENPRTSETALTLSSSDRKPEAKKEKKVRARKGPLPPDWQPSAAHFQAAERLTIPRSAVLDKAEDMRLWAKASGELKADWDATFHGFLRRDASKLAARGGRAPPPNRPTGFADLLAQMTETQNERPDDNPEYDLDLTAEHRATGTG